RATAISMSMPLGHAPYTDARVDTFLENLLPDAEPIRRRMQTTLGAESTRAFDLLAIAGRDCVGALQLLPDDMPIDVRRIDATPIDDHAIAAVLRDLAVTAPLGMRDLGDFRMSIAGAHEKTALLRGRDGWWLPRGATPTSHLLKPPIGPTRGGPDLSDSVENEWLSMRLARALGLPVANVEMASFEDVRVLVVERFDRRWSRDRSWLIRLPQEDVCQALGVSPALKYEADGGPGIARVMTLLLSSEIPAEDRVTFLRANVVMWLLAAIDAHAKNYSLHLLPGGSMRLAPLYDIVSAYPAMARRELHRSKIKLAMGVLSTSKHYRWADVRPRHWLSTAEACAFPRSEMERVLDETRARIERAIVEVERVLPRRFPPSVSDPIFEGLRAMRGES
ncbi:MAG: type II toxin-antitoxin system HipA family toxin, partial [Deltaproteobacteria bacterium]|nr:type II toxin-antitoxin system HipA family toxin [Deltaproteobacteria bacterium]